MIVLLLYTDPTMESSKHNSCMSLLGDDGKDTCQATLLHVLGFNDSGLQ